MTRETRVGLVVTCSFVCLVGVVLVKRLTAPAPTGEDEVTLLTPEEGKPAAGADPDQPSVEPVPVTPRLVPPPAPIVQAQATEVPMTSSPSPEAPATPAPAPAPASTPSGGESGGGFQLPPPAAAPAQPGERPMTQEKQPEFTLNSEAKPPEAPAAPKVDLPPAVPAAPAETPTTSAGEAPLPPPPPAAEQKSPMSDKPEPMASGFTIKPDARPPAAPAEAVPLPPPPAPMSEQKPAPAQPGFEVKPAEAPAAPAEPAAHPAGFEIKPEKPAGPSEFASQPPPPKVVASTNEPNSATPRSDLPPMNTGFSEPPAAVPLPPVAAPPPNEPRPEPARPALPPEQPGFVSPPPPPPAAALPPMTTPTLVAQAPRPESRFPRRASPQVESYDEETYRCRANDTFAAISQSRYQSDRYAQALYLFNRDHPLASGAMLRNGAPTLQAGDAVYVPPVSILEKRYAQAIAGLAAPPAGGAAEAGPAPMSAAPAPPRTPIAATTRNYTVGGQGETMFEIAKRLLGNGMRWAEISKLNPGVRSDYPVPAGTVLQVPEDAKVEGR